MSRLGQLFLKGGADGDSPDDDLALSWFQKAKETGEDVDRFIDFINCRKNNILSISFDDFYWEGENTDIEFASTIMVSDFGLLNNDAVFLALFTPSDGIVRYKNSSSIFAVYAPMDSLSYKHIFFLFHGNIDFSDTALSDYSDGRIDLEIRLFRGELNKFKAKYMGYKNIPSDWELLASHPVAINHIRHLFKKDEWYIIND